MSDQHKKHQYRPKPTAKEREFFTSNFAMLIKAGVPVGQAIESLQETSRTKRLRKSLDFIAQDINEGVPLWKALKNAHFVSSQTLSLIELGETSGRLIENLQVAARQEEKQRIFRAKVRSALMYPTFVISLTVIVGLGVAWFLLPRLAETFKSLDVSLPTISRVLINVGAFLQEHGIVAVPIGVAAFCLLIYILFLAPKTSSIGKRILFHTPGVKQLLLQVEIARFGYLLGTLLDAGLGINQAFRALESATTMPQYKKLYRHMAQAIDDGYNFKASFGSFKGSGAYIPVAVQQMVIAGERSGALPDTLKNIGNIYEEKANITTENLEAILEPILLIIVWFGVLAVAVAVIMPIYGLIGGLNNV